MELTYSPARPEDAPVIFGFAKELIERYETDPARIYPGPVRRGGGGLLSVRPRRGADGAGRSVRAARIPGPGRRHRRAAPLPGPGEARVPLCVHGERPGRGPLRTGGLSEGGGREPHPLHHGAIGQARFPRLSSRPSDASGGISSAGGACLLAKNEYSIGESHTVNRGGDL